MSEVKPTDRWRLVEELYHAAMELPEPERNEYLEHRCGGDNTLRADVASLLVYGGQAMKWIDQRAIDVMAEAIAAEPVLANGAVAEPLIGKQVGKYRIVSRLADGGMGEVYRAVRADDAYRKEVALKLGSAGRYSPAFVERFRNERQILASLEHPHIAQLYDGGTTEEGVPYLVMELIDGENILDYCARRRLTIGDRLSLFLQVCSAVEYAHRHLIVHRDIKPENIFVTVDGAAKLLDFGIAQILEADGSRQILTITNLHAFTPAYASPEQVKGEAITTATDVFSLGVVLYELLTGQMPNRSKEGMARAIGREICEAKTEKPSTAVLWTENHPDGSRGSVSNPSPADCEGSMEKLSKRLTGDLDSILLQALCKDPERRYASVDKFAEDVRRHLNRLPVLARKDSFRYRAEKFIARHKVAVAAAVAGVVLLAAGVSAVAYEAHVARVERARAERRFQSLQKLAHALIFDIHDSIRDLPGSTAARKLVVEKALEYLNGVSKDAANDPALQREIASAYERIGDVRGSGRFANLGDTRGALESYRKAFAIRLQLASLQSATRDDRTVLAADYDRLSEAFMDLGNIPEATDNARAAYRIAEEMALLNRNNPLLEEGWAATSFVLARSLGFARDLPGAAEFYARSASIRETIQGGSADFRKLVRLRLAGTYGYWAGIECDQEKLDQAIPLQEKASRILAKLLAADPRNSTIRQFLAQSDFWIGYYLARKGATAQALARLEVVLHRYQALVAADPRDALALQYLAQCHREIADIYLRQKNSTGAMEQARQAVTADRSLLASEFSPDDMKLNELVQSEVTLGDAWASEAAQNKNSTRGAEAAWQSAQLSFEEALRAMGKMKRPDSANRCRIGRELSRARMAMAALAQPGGGLTISMARH